MKIVVVHSRYRSAAPSGENRVVDQEMSALRGQGHEVELFERRSDEIGGWPAVRKAALPATVVWNGQARKGLRALLRAYRPDPPRRQTDMESITDSSTISNHTSRCLND